MKKFIFSISVFLIVGILPILLINFVIDPLQFYRKATLYKPAFYKDQRFQNPGLAKNYDYDAILLGTSLSENFRMTEMEEYFGGKFLKLTMQGSSLNEQRKLLNIVLKAGKVKRVYWGLESYTLNVPADKTGGEIYNFPYYLYDENPINDFFYLFNAFVFKRSFAIISNSIYREFDDPNEIGQRGNDSTQFGAELMMKFHSDTSLQKKADIFIGISKSNPMVAGYHNIDRNLLQVIEHNEEIQFILFFTPPSIAFHSSRLHNIKFDTQLKLKSYLINSIVGYPHVKVFDFELAQEINSNLDQYRDLVHYAPEVNSILIAYMSTGKYQVDTFDIAVQKSVLTSQIHAIQQELNRYNAR